MEMRFVSMFPIRTGDVVTLKVGPNGTLVPMCAEGPAVQYVYQGASYAPFGTRTPVGYADGVLDAAISFNKRVAEARAAGLTVAYTTYDPCKGPQGMECDLRVTRLDQSHLPEARQ